MKAQKYTKETVLEIGVHDRKFPEIKVGSCVRISQRIVEGDKERIQHFEGDVLAIQNHGVATTITVRRIGANGVAIERVLPVYSPTITDIAVIRQGDVCRAKLYYMRERVGRQARVTEKKESHHSAEAA